MGYVCGVWGVVSSLVLKRMGIWEEAGLVRAA